MKSANITVEEVIRNVLLNIHQKTALILKETYLSGSRVSFFVFLR